MGNKRIGKRGLCDVIMRIEDCIYNSSNTRWELFIVFFISLLLCAFIQFCYHIPQIKCISDSVNLLILGFAFNTFAIFVSDTEKINKIFIGTKLGGVNFEDELLSVSIIGLIIPVVGLLFDVITILNLFSNCIFDFCRCVVTVMGVVWILHSVFHILSLKLEDNKTTEQ